MSGAVVLFTMIVMRGFTGGMVMAVFGCTAGFQLRPVGGVLVAMSRIKGVLQRHSASACKRK